MTPEMIQKLAETLNITEAEALKFVEQEIARKEAGKRYRQSQAYKTRLLQQKLVRQALKEVEAKL